MANHEFGIMQNQPMNKERFDEYEPNKYDCIVVDDNFIEPILIDLQKLDCYWHTLQNPGKGLAYCGITLIPPESMDILIKILLLLFLFKFSLTILPPYHIHINYILTQIFHKKKK